MGDVTGSSSSAERAMGLNGKQGAKLAKGHMRLSSL
jgi:hypothetical protein